MPLYICRWPNGDFTAVSAHAKSDAIRKLDEIGCAWERYLFRLDDFMVSFKLIKNKVEGGESGYEEPFEMEGFGEQTQLALMEKAYPRIDAIQHKGECTVAEFNAVLDAERLRFTEPKEDRSEAQAERDFEETVRVWPDL